MAARPPSRPGPTSPTAAAVIAVAVFLASWVAVHVGFYARGQIVDTPVYQRYGDAMVAGRVPYRDFAVEYPPAALPVFGLPSLLGGRGDLDAYERAFGALMFACGALAVALVALARARDGAGPVRLAVALAPAALAPVALGSVVVSRYDLWPVALTASAVVALAAERLRLGFAVLGLAAAAKIYPAALLPVACVWAWRRGGRRRALTGLALCGGVVATVVVPFAALSPQGVERSLAAQLGRPLQIESLGASLLLAAHQTCGLDLVVLSTHGSQNLAGRAAGVTAAVQSGVQALALAWVWVWFARGPAERSRLHRALALSIAVFVAFGKVLSPQFLLWLVPVVPLVRGRRGLVAGALLLLALVLTQLWFPLRYWDLALRLDATPSWLVLARNLVLVALVAALAWPGGDAPASQPGYGSLGRRWRGLRRRSRPPRPPGARRRSPA